MGELGWSRTADHRRRNTTCVTAQLQRSVSPPAVWRNAKLRSRAIRLVTKRGLSDPPMRVASQQMRRQAPRRQVILRARLETHFAGGRTTASLSCNRYQTTLQGRLDLIHLCPREPPLRRQFVIKPSISRSKSDPTVPERGFHRRGQSCQVGRR
jgi:hypothetical protein